MPGGRFSVKAIFRAVDKFTAPVSRMQRRMLRFTTSARRGLRAVDRANSAVAGGFRRVGIAAAVAGGVVAVGLGKVISTGADFEQAITNVGAVSLKSRSEIDALERSAIQLGKTTKFTGSEVAAGMETMARAGFTTKEILQGIPGILNAAAASGLELAEVSNHVSNVLKGMGLATSEAGRVADVLALASSKTNSSIGSLGESMKNVASTARQLGVPLESVVASVALLQDVGLDASVAGSALNTMLTKLATPPKRIAREMKRLGLSFKKSNGDMKDFGEVLGTISELAKKSGGNMDQVAVLAELVGLRGQKAAANLAKLFESGKVDKLTSQLEKAKDVAEKMAAIRMDTLKGDMTLLESAVDGVTVRLFKMHGGALRPLIQSLTKWISENQRLIDVKVGDFIDGLNEKLPVIKMWLERIATAIGVFAVWTIAVKAAEAALVIFEIAVKASVLATELWAFAVATANGTTWLAVGAQKAWTAMKWFGVAASQAGLGATIKSTGAVVLQNTAIRVVTFAAGLYNTATWLGTAAMTAFTGGAGAASTAVFGLNVAMAPLLITLLAVGAAAGAAFLAVNQLNKLDKETGGLGFTGVISELVQGRDPLVEINRRLDAEAANEASESASKKAIVASIEQRSTGALINANAELAGGSAGELTVKDETGRVEVTKQPKAGKIKLEQPSGAF